jgi:hypothetical protein
VGKHDMPSLEFAVERGRLVPAGPYEAEVLDTYRPGSKLTVTLHQKRSLPLLKKYWAVMRDVVDKCKTPWNSPDEASDAIKLALGVTDIGKTVKGQWFIRPGSIAFTSMDEAAFRDYFEKAMAILAEVSGINPDELRDRYSHLSEVDNSSSADSSPADGSDGEASSSTSTVAADPSDDEPATEEGDYTGQVSSEAAPSSESITPIKRMLCEECIENMLRAALSAKDEAETIEKARLAFLEPQNLGDMPEFVNRCAETAKRVIGRPAERERASEYLTSKIPAAEAV